MSMSSMMSWLVMVLAVDAGAGEVDAAAQALAWTRESRTVLESKPQCWQRRSESGACKQWW